MILKADRIVDRLLKSGQDTDPLVVTPMPDVDELKASGSAALDLRLGAWFASMRQSRLSHLNVLLPSSTPEENRLLKSTYVPFGSDFILHPRNFVLGVTFEWLRLPSDLAGYVIGKSSWGRRGLVIATAAGVHPGFAGCLTLEITNLGELPISIRPGMRICQLFIHSVDGDTKLIDRSHLLGHRKPVLGKVTVDEVARKLAGE